MTSIRKFAYAALLAFTTLTFAPAAVSAQSGHGKFTLPHDVHWQNAMVPAGEYRFSYESDGIGVLRLSRIGGGGFLFVVPETADPKPTDLNRIVIESTPAGSYVSAMQLPEFGMTLQFNVPSSGTEKQMAKAVATPLAAAR